MSRLQFVGIGAHRSGTVWINTCLGEHPEVCCSSLKEPSFFSNDAYYESGFAAYASLFRHCDPRKKVMGEFSPDYLTVPQAPERIKRHIPNAKLIACLRNPIERMYSHYLLKRSMGRLSHYPVFDIRFIESTEGQRYLALGRYAAGLTRYFELFPRNQMRVTITEDIARDPRTFIQDIYAFLEVDSTFVPLSVERRVNFYVEGKRIYSAFADRAMLKAKPFLKRILGSRRTGRALGFLRGMNRRHNLDSAPSGVKPSMPAPAHELLKMLYAEEIERVSYLLGRDMREVWI